MIPGFRFARKLVYTGIVLSVLFLGASVFVQHYAETKIADAVATRFDLSERPTVHISGFPILVRVLQRHIPSAEVIARNVERDGLKIDELRMKLEDISGSLSRSGGGGITLHIGRGEMTARVSDASVSAFVKARGKDVRLRFGTEATSVRASAAFAGGPHVVTGQGNLSLRQQVIMFVVKDSTLRVDGEKPNPVLLAEARRRANVSIKVPLLPLDIKVTHIQPEDGFLVLSTELSGRDIALG